jgi:nucleotide-binding universal stress UspA family protein
MKNILYCVADRDGFEATKVTAAALARRFDAALRIFHAVAAPWTPLAPATSTDDAELRELDGMEQDPVFAGLAVALETEETHDDLVDCIAGAAERNASDLLLVPTHARSGLARMIQGSVAELLVRTCSIPVLALRLDDETRHDSPEFDRIIAATDLAPTTPEALRQLLPWARRLGCGITLTHVVESYALAVYPMGGVVDLSGIELQMRGAAREIMAQWIEALKAEAEGVDLDIAIETGPVLTGLREGASAFAHPLLVLPSSGRDSLEDSILGSHAERVLRDAPAPVLVLPINPVRS